MSDKALELRREFDASFAGAPVVRHIAQLRFLAIGIAGEPFAIDCLSLSGLERHRNITALPTTTPGLLGICGLRGELIPVYSLPILLGRTEPIGKAPWLAIGSRVAFAFNTFVKHLTVEQDSLVTTHETGRVLQHDGGTYAVVDFASLLAQLRKGI